jgi:hypothetical protein
VSEHRDDRRHTATRGRPSLLGTEALLPWTAERIVGAVRGGRRAGVVVAQLALIAVACGGGGQDPEVADPAPAATNVVVAGNSTTCQDPPGDAYAIHPSQLPTDGDDPNIRAADIPNVSVEATRSGVAMVFRRDDPGDPPTGQLQHTLWMQDENGTTGVVQANREARRAGAWDILAGADVDSLEPIDATGANLSPVRTFIPIKQEDLPVEPPFSWAVEHAIPTSGVADICPNVDQASPLGQIDALPVFPEDDTVEAAGDPTVSIVGEDYAFEEVPERADVGTRLTFRNDADEPHELVLLRLNEDAPPVEEFAQMPPEEGQPYADLVGVSIAMPGQPGVMREGELLLDDPGTYVLLCGFPTGVTPEHVKENFAGPPGGPPAEEFGPPHVAQGMFATIEVEA